MTSYCVDASFVLGRLIASPATPRVVARWDSLQHGDELVSTPLLLAECTSVLSEHAYRRQLSLPDARSLVALVVRLDIRLLDIAECYERALDIAHALGWAKAYDALYLAVAEHEAAELLTVDRGMRDAARRLGISATFVG